MCSYCSLVLVACSSVDTACCRGLTLIAAAQLHVLLGVNSSSIELMYTAVIGTKSGQAQGFQPSADTQLSTANAFECT
jgi:hypothetical protein